MKELLILLTGLLLFALQANGQAFRNVVEAGRNNRQIAVDKVQITRDQKELDEFNMQMDLLNEALVRNDVETADRLRYQLIEAMRREISQGNAKLSQDKREVSQSHSEVRSENREIRGDRGEIRKKGETLKESMDLRGDKFDRRDDRQDLRDDKRDRKNQVAILNRQKDIIGRADLLPVRNGSTRQIEELMRLFSQFELTMERDLEFTRSELVEDRAEKAEDRIERHDDRQERKDGRR